MHRPIINATLLTVALLACGAADKEQAADARKDQREPNASGKAKSTAKSKEDAKPACMHCGVTCCLQAVCVCEPGKKKKPKNEYEATCEPICVAGCGSTPWPFGRCRDRVGCTSCCEEPCPCPGWVRNRKALKKETTDKEVSTIKRKVAYVCDTCAGCGAGSCCKDNREHRHATWWTHLAAWWKP
jgi:hypothetical protein